MKKKDVKALEPGLYKIHLKSGGFSWAAVGVTSDGKSWMARPEQDNQSISGRSAWKVVESAERVFLTDKEKNMATLITIKKNQQESFTDQLQPGFYKIFWKSGGSSLAAVGIADNGKRWIAATGWSNGSTMIRCVQDDVYRIFAIHFSKKDIDDSEALLMESIKLAEQGNFGAARSLIKRLSLINRKASSAPLTEIAEADNRDARTGKSTPVAAAQIPPPLKVIKKDEIAAALLSFKENRESFCIPEGFDLVLQHDFDNCVVVVHLKWLSSGRTVALMGINYRNDQKDSIEITGKHGRSPIDGLTGISLGHIKNTLPNIIALAITQDQEIKGWIKAMTGLSLRYTQDPI